MSTGLDRTNGHLSIVRRGIVRWPPAAGHERREIHVGRSIRRFDPSRRAQVGRSGRGRSVVGAVILGKTTLSEWANFRSFFSSSGWSGRGGQCNNPYAIDRNPCGSSSGSGAAASANFTAVSIGTETDGSIVCPANANGVVGIKPTVGLVSRAGVIPISHTQDTVGPHARTVADAAAVLGA